MPTRAEAIATRIEQGAESLASYAEKLSDADWKKTVRDGRTVGVCVHHVASVYPIEVDLAKAVASGKAVTDVTWDAVAQLNANHAKDNAKTTQKEAADLVRKNSKAAAAWVRTLSDAQLDSAAPFSLSFGAPVTAQFVIEDHAMRHSWHHLARIKATLGH